MGQLYFETALEVPATPALWSLAAPRGDLGGELAGSGRPAGVDPGGLRRRASEALGGKVRPCAVRMPMTPTGVKGHKLDVSLLRLALVDGATA